MTTRINAPFLPRVFHDTGRGLPDVYRDIQSHPSLRAGSWVGRLVYHVDENTFWHVHLDPHELQYELTPLPGEYYGLLAADTPIDVLIGSLYLENPRFDDLLIDYFRHAPIDTQDALARLIGEGNG